MAKLYNKTFLFGLKFKKKIEIRDAMIGRHIQR